MNKKKYGIGFLLIAAVFVLFFACATGSGTTRSAAGDGTAGEPVWVSSPEAEYPEAEYMSAVGVGDTLNEAKSQAASAISQQFQVKVQSSFEVSEKYKEIIESDKKLYSTETETREEIMLESEQELINLQYGESHTADDGRVYTVAYLNRNETANVYQTRLETLFKKVAYFISRAETAERVPVAYAYQRKAVFTDQTVTTLMNQLSIISTVRYKLVNIPYSREELYSTFDELSGQMVFSVVIRNDKDGKIESSIKQLLSENNFKLDDKSLYSVEGTVRFEEMPAEKEDYFVVKWYLSLDITDEKGVTVVSLDEDKRETAVSEAAARSFSYADIEKALKSKFIMEFLRYLDDMVSMSSS